MLGFREEQSVLTVDKRVDGNGKIKWRTIQLRDMALGLIGGLNGREQGIAESPQASIPIT